MPFTAVCPHCKETKLRVSNEKRGKLVTCPNCEQPFMLVPEDPYFAPLVDFRAPKKSRSTNKQSPESTADSSPVEVEAEPAPPPHSPTEPANAAAHNDTVRSPAVLSQPALPPAPPVEGEREEAVRFALAALGLFGAAIIATQVPYGRFAAVALALIGAVFGGFSLLGLEKKAWLGWTGLGLNSLALLLVVLLPGWLGVSSWLPAKDPEAGPKPVTAVGKDGSLPRPADWVDANQAVWEQGDVRVAVTSATIAPLDATAKDPAKRKELALRLGLKLTNVGVARAVEYSGWVPGTPAAPVLTTSAGTTVPVKPHAGPPPSAAQVFPGKSAEAILVFDVPPASSDDLRLELPIQGFGGVDPVRFKIPRNMIGGSYLVQPRKE